MASLLIAKPYFPWPDVDTMIDRAVCMAGLGLAAGARLDITLPLPEITARLDRLRS
jgi:hypothetical protein